MEPTPPHIPIYVGGLSDIALRRAARNDGWIGDLITTDRAIERVDRLRELRAERGLSMDDFAVLTPLTDAFTPEHYERAEASGINGIITMPWMFYTGPQASLAEKIDGMRKFRKDLGLDGQGDGLGRDAPVAVVGGDGEAINEPGDRPCVGGVLE